MDLTVFNNYRQQAQQQGEQKFNEPLDTARHRDPDLHLIGDDLPTPTTVVTAGSVAVGISPRAAREDHFHGTFDETVKRSYALNDGSALSPSLYWPDSGGVSNLGIYRTSGNSVGFAYNSGSSFLSFGPTNLQAVDMNWQIIGDMQLEAGVGYSGGLDTEGAIYSDEDVRARVTSNYIQMGQWPNNTIYRGVSTSNGYLLLNSSGDKQVYLRNGSNNNLQLGVNGSNHATIQASDKRLVAKVGLAATLGGTTSFNTIRYGTFGIFYQFTSNEWRKEKIKSIDSDHVGKIIDQLRPVTFIDKHLGDWEEPAEAKEWREKDLRYGFIAEEVWEVADGHLSTVDYGTAALEGELNVTSWDEAAMTAVAIAEIKSLRKRVAQLEEQLTNS